MLSPRRLPFVLLALFALLSFLYFISPRSPSGFKGSATSPSTKPPASSSSTTTTSKNVAISYDLSTPPAVGCERIVSDLQLRLIKTYRRELAGIRYANLYGYLETPNKGDAAIWAAQQILLSTLGVTPMEACRFVDRECDVAAFSSALEKHKEHAAIIMAGGGNFNDYYHTDHPSRLKMVEKFGKEWRIRAFPQSIHMTKPHMIKQTEDVFNNATDLRLAARDGPSYEWLRTKFGARRSKVGHVLTPDVAFMFGSRPDIREQTKKTHNIYILARDDKEVAEGDSKSIAVGEGTLDLGPTVGNVTYRKIDWEHVDTPGIDKETGKNQRAWAKAMQGFEMLASADLVITDRLHGHIMATVIGTPHVLMDSKLKKNVRFHDTWTKECACTRVAGSIKEALEVARLYFEAKKSGPTNQK